MNGVSLLTTRLQAWAESAHVQMKWHGDLLRLECGGVGRAAVTFPIRFWNEFATLAASEQEMVLDAINLAVSLQFDAGWAGQYVKDIPIGMSLLEGRARRE